MKTVKNYTIRQSTRQDLNDLNNTIPYYNNPLLLEYNNKKFVIDSGTSDNIDIFKEGNCIYVLSSNYMLNYAGLTMCNLNCNEFAGEIFFDDNNMYDLNKQLKKDFFNYSTINQCKILKAYVY